MVSVLGIFTCYNRKEKTQKCIRSLIDKNKNVKFSFVACDDRSTDGSYEYLIACNNIKVIRGSGSLFYTGGMIKAIEEAQKIAADFDYVLLFNDDVDFGDNAINRLVSQIKTYQDSNTVLVGSTCDSNNELTYGGVVYPHNVRMQYIKYGPEYRGVCDTFHANCVLIPSSIFVKVGNMDGKYRHSLGDFDYGLKISRMGYKIYVSDFYVGICIIDSPKGGWKDRSLTRLERIKKKESPKGVPINEWFHYVYKNFGFIRAVYTSVSPYLKILFKK